MGGGGGMMHYCYIQVLDAPELQDDFYLNLVDWSSQNQLAVGLNRCVYLWSAHTSQVHWLYCVYLFINDRYKNCVI
jgi:hypothetical protein